MGNLSAIGCHDTTQLFPTPAIILQRTHEQENITVLLFSNLLLIGIAVAVGALELLLKGKGQVAVNGYEPVAYFTTEEPTSGDPALTHDWNGAIWQVASAAQCAGQIQSSMRRSTAATALMRCPATMQRLPILRLGTFMNASFT